MSRDGPGRSAPENGAPVACQHSWGMIDMHGHRLCNKCGEIFREKVERLPGYSAIGGRLDGKVTSVTMFAGRLFAATANGVFMLNEQGEWAALELKP